MLWTLGALFLVGIPLAVCVGVLANDAVSVRNTLQSVVPLAASLKTQALGGDAKAAAATHALMSAKVEVAVEKANGPLWRAGELIPVAGDNFKVVRQLVNAAEIVVSGGVEPLIEVAASVNPTSFTPVDGAIDIQPLVAAIPNIAAADMALKRASAEVEGIDAKNTLKEVASAKTQLADAIEEVAAPVSTLNDIVPLLAPALGADGPRTYAVMFQNNAEARALGGSALSFAVVNVDQGRIALKQTLPAGGNNFARYPESVVPIPDGVEAIFPDGTYNSFIANVTARPSFVSAAEAVQEFWRLQYGTQIDGVLSIDPAALSYVLRATGPLPLSTGDRLSSESLVSLLLNEVYLRYDSGNYKRDNVAQDLVYAEAVDSMFTAVSTGAFDPTALIGALSQGWEERRILYWSAHEEEQSKLEEIGLNGEIPISDEVTERYGVYFHDNVGSKLGYYLNQSVSIASADCKAGGGQMRRVSVDITNTIDPAEVKDLPLSIVGAYQLEKLKPAVQRMFVMLYAPPGSKITGATVEGKAVALEDLHDTDYPVGKLTILVNPGQTVSLSYDVASGGTGTKGVEVQTTPMVNPTTISKAELDCSAVSVG